ncbi:uncharacterized protein OGAPODRAFT_78322 [Ogataea polymorpha]|uniref:uncharacterized protein n=1 Tax=Ogataea polymorpha TaxID=460523 RepID=UPI0007F4E34E|nr:uncharacterized protein OGAPODRAFT_78322 [Ogataea polymorpha]OBA14025.1 hypothetical protein OGAPODRAFT_78322 [Ogataea polymorpha]
MTTPILEQSYGYGFVLGIGAAFALLMSLITRVLSKYLGQVQNSERFTTASRNVGSGLIASSTVSAWTWPATLLSSGAWSYAHGVSGGFLYGVGGTIQVTLFVFVCLQIKSRAPAAHTVSECFSVRFGPVGHWVFLCYVFATNVLISSLLLLGGSQGFSATTGMNVVAASFLLPLGVMVYTALGGLKATFISDWIHTVIIYIILLVASYKIYCSSPLIGSPGKMYDLLQEAQIAFPSATGQSYLSYRDSTMLMLTWTVCLGGLSSVFGDPGYSQRAIASSSTQVFQGYTLGALCWAVIPTVIGSSAGLACRALLSNPHSPTYPNELSTEEVNNGLPVIYGLYAVMGKSGAAAGLIMLFMSVTSASSAELIAFSSVTTYDVYRTYINPKASGAQLVRAAHIAVVGFSLFMAVLSVVFNYVGVTVGWLLTFSGIIVNPSVFTVVITLFWSKMTRLALVIGAPLGTLSGVLCWIAGAYCFGNNVVDKDTLNITKATFIGNCTALFSTPLYIVLVSLLKPDPEPFDMNKFRTSITLADDMDAEEEHAAELPANEQKKLRSHIWAAAVINIVLVLGVYVVLPLGLYGSNHDLSKASFTGFIVVVLMWLLVAAMYIILFPLWQGRHSIKVLLQVLLGRGSADGTSSVEVVQLQQEQKS